MLTELLLLLLRIASHNLRHKVLISSLRRVPRVAEDAELGNFGLVLRVVALRLAHSSHLSDQFARFRVLATIDNQLPIPVAAGTAGLVLDLQAVLMVFSPSNLDIRAATPAQGRIAVFLLLFDQAFGSLFQVVIDYVWDAE